MICPWNIFLGNCHAAAIRVTPVSSEAIAHRMSMIIRNNDLKLVNLHAEICLLGLIMSSSTKYSLCPEGMTFYDCHIA